MTLEDYIEELGGELTRFSSKIYMDEIGMGSCHYAYEKAVNFVLLRNIEFSEEREWELDRLSDELVLNAREYGCNYNPEADARITFVVCEQGMVIQVEDPGEGFDFNAIPPPTLTREQCQRLPDDHQGGGGTARLHNFAKKYQYTNKGATITAMCPYDF